MAVLFQGIVYDGKRCKVFDLVEADSSAAANTLTTTFAACGMTDLQGGIVPPEQDVITILSAADENVQGRLFGVTATAFEFRKMTAGAGVTAIRWRITLRIPKGIAG